MQLVFIAGACDCRKGAQVARGAGCGVRNLDSGGLSLDERRDWVAKDTIAKREHDRAQRQAGPTDHVHRPVWKAKAVAPRYRTQAPYLILSLMLCADHSGLTPSRPPCQRLSSVFLQPMTHSQSLLRKFFKPVYIVVFTRWLS